MVYLYVLRYKRWRKARRRTNNVNGNSEEQKKLARKENGHQDDRDLVHINAEVVDNPQGLTQLLEDSQQKIQLSLIHI